MLRIYNKTDSALSIENYELPGRGSLEIDIPYSSNLKMMEMYNTIAVIEVKEATEKAEVLIQQEPETSADESEDKNEEVAITKNKRTRRHK